MWQLSNWKVKLQIKDSTMDALGNFGIRAARFNYQRVLFRFFHRMLQQEIWWTCLEDCGNLASACKL